MIRCRIVGCRDDAGEHVFCAGHDIVWTESTEYTRYMLLDDGNRCKRALMDFCDRIAAEELNAGNATGGSVA